MGNSLWSTADSPWDLELPRQAPRAGTHITVSCPASTVCRDFLLGSVDYKVMNRSSSTPCPASRNRVVKPRASPSAQQHMQSCAYWIPGHLPSLTLVFLRLQRHVDKACSPVLPLPSSPAVSYPGICWGRLPPLSCISCMIQ